MKTYIIGHIKPDTDASVATLAFKHLFDQEKCWNHPNSIPCITHPLNNEAKFIFNKFNQTAPKLIYSKDINPQDKIVLVDHNEKSQRLKNLNPNQITDIFDHHKLNLNLNNPIFITTKPWGSTCTIAWFLINLHQHKIPKTLASLMLAAILSDTVVFKSSTTTNIDKKAAKNLAKIANQDIKKLGFEILQAKSNISNLTIENIITKDYKYYNFSGINVFINQIETVEQKKVLSQIKSDLLKALIKYKKDNSINIAIIAVSDIFRKNTKLILPGTAEIKLLEKAFNQKVKNNILNIGPLLSRKKDIVPAIEKALL